MGKRNDKLGRAAHIKRHTVGTSNEISFSVLDAAKNELDGDAGKDAAAPASRFGHISLFTLPLRRKKTIATPTKERGLPLSSGEFASVDSPVSTSSLGAIDLASSDSMSAEAPSSARKTPTLPAASAASAAPRRSPEEEIARRKARRLLHRIMAASLIVIVGLCLAGAGGWYLYQDHQRHLGQVAQLDEALNLIRKADEAVVALDRTVADPLDPASIAAADEVLGQLPAARDQLSQADDIARRVSVELRESTEKEAANQTVAAVAARLALLESGQQIIEQAQLADAAARDARAAWQEVVKGDALARDAAALVVDTTEANVSASKDKTNAAIEAFAAAQSAFDELAFAYPAADWSALSSYVSKRLEAMGYALASDDAILARDKEEAAAQNDAYNLADAEAAAIAADLPDDPARPAFASFEQSTAELSETYATARSQAGSADAFIRDYLGTTSK